MKKVICGGCNTEQPHYAKGMCWSCWIKAYNQTEKHKAAVKAYHTTDSFLMSEIRSQFKKLSKDGQEKIITELWK